MHLEDPATTPTGRHASRKAGHTGVGWAGAGVSAAQVSHLAPVPLRQVDAVLSAALQAEILELLVRLEAARAHAGLAPQRRH